jgi:predicted metal-dependent hydrolase
MEKAPARFEDAVKQFNRGEFFECHETLEDLWRPLAAGPEKNFLQGLLQVGVGFHHWKNGNVTGAKNLLTAGLDKLQQTARTDYEPPIQLSALIQATEPLLVCLQGQPLQSVQVPEFPKVFLR